MERISNFLCFLFCFLVSNIAPAFAAQAQPIPLKEGINTIALNQLQIHIIKGRVELMNAHSFDTYTMYITPNGANGAWLQVPFSNRTSPPDYFLNNAESADSNIQSIDFYKKDNNLYVLRTTKFGLRAPELNLKKTKVKFRTYKFNEDVDTPILLESEEKESRTTWLNADEAAKFEGMGN
ncbi:carbapenem self-resistance protein CarG family protein [Chitinolyticbacter albus]|uniref:carbapenem self-resistance protein CarG family protein n=1 Tax=Chitinolyticbacter albus TaxID=2961951 RepID=UPI00210935B4|nr:hypothetical protein [Chitinolyticbacter albus]